jgi:hypothetical protein
MMIKGMEDKMTKTEWILGTGKKATVTVVSRAIEKTVNTGWGSEQGTGKYHVETELVAEVEGMGIVGKASQPSTVPANDRGIVAVIGKLGLNTDAYQLVLDAIATENANLTEDAGYKAYLNRVAEGEKAEKEYNELHNATQKAMDY